MTNKEALDLIQHKLDLAVDDASIMTDKEYEAFSLCAKALEKEPCEDAISREQAKEAIRDRFKDLPLRVEINTILNELTSVTPSYNSIKTELKSCDDCISRQAVLDLVVANHTELNGANVVMYSPLCKDIKQLPSVTPQPKIGKWTRVKDKTGLLLWECTCG